MSFDSSRSSTSQGKGNKRKKSIDSKSSIQSHARKSHQKTLGMAWGANSVSSSKSSARNSSFSDFGSYMEEKNRKLRNQFDADASKSSLGDSSGRTDLFRGIAIFVDGFTIPSSQELRGYMLKHGGRFENYFSRNRVTHIVCSNLADSKIRNLRSFSRGLPVVKPTWVLDSVAANRVLNWVPYQLDQLVNETHNQPKLSAFFSSKSNSNSNIDEAAKVGECIDHKSQLGEESASHMDDNSRDMRKVEPSSADSEEKASVGEAFQSSDSSPHKPSTTAVSSCCSGDKSNNEPLASGILGPPYPSHSTLGDPNFVENYFKNSRLHFIGTWRSRYRKRFPCLSKGAKQGNSSVNGPPVLREAAIIHIDMDCFFVSVILRNLPDLQDKPVAVCHSDNPKGTAEISSANYPARDYGVRAGMFVRDAKALCPHLVIFPYNFKAYEEVADQFYSILHKYCNKVQAVSCDEAFLDVTDLEDQDPVHIASVIRQEICEATGCTASAGISGNMLMARLATKTAKPNGQCFIPSTKVDDYLNNLPIKALPGIGHVLAEKLKSRHIQTCGQLRKISKESLQKDFGTKTGDMLWNYCRGIDNRPVEVIQEMKSIGAEVNWGVRLNSSKDSQDFLLRLCKEVTSRLQGCGMQGRTITLKLKKRKKGVGEPEKYLGCGECENLSHSITVPIATDDEDVLQRVSKHLFGSFRIDVREVRGIGLQVSRLESADTTKQGREKEVLRSWIASTSPKIGEPVKTNCPTKGSSGGEVSLLDGRCQSILENHGNQHPDANPVRLRINENGSSQIDPFIGKACTDQTLTLPPVCNLDMEVLESLPPEILREINEMYCGKLNDFIKKRQGHDGETSTSFTLLPEEIQDSGIKNKGKQPLCSSPVHLYNNPTVPEINESMVREARSASVSSSGPLNLHLSSMDAKLNDLMPASLSQVDISVLQQLPEELKADVLELLPAHRTSECSTESSLDYKRKPPCGSGITTKNGTSVNGVDLTSKNYLWIGSPPKWVEKFKASNCLILSTFAGFYCKSFPSGILSSILQYAISSPLSLDLSSEAWDEAQCNFCELLQQYIDLKIESDIEEIYICFRLLERFTRRSEFLLQVFDKVLPSLQAYVGEKYGGTLQF